MSNARQGMAADKVFISYVHADTERSKPLRAALSRWGVDFWFDDSNAQVGHVLLDELLTGIRPCDILIRLCTPETHRSVWMQRELGMYLAYQREKSLQIPGHQSKLINVCFEGYHPDDLDHRYLFINVGEKPDAAWIDELRRALGKPMGAVEFKKDEASYLWWTGAYPEGYVLSADRKPKASWLALHRPYCDNVSNVKRWGDGTFTEGAYIKICALDASELETWARTQVDPNATLITGCNCIVHGTSR
jgi:hypothetical protein